MTRTGRRDQFPASTASSRGISWYYKSTSENLASARWSSSERPLFVRTVWVGSIRHAILSLDDPLLRHHQTSSRKPSLANTTSDDATSSETSSGSHVQLEDYLERNCFEGDEDTSRTKGKRKKIKKKYRRHNPEPGDSQVVDIDLSKALDSTTPETDFFLGEESRNALSERVFQWLDLANKAAATSGRTSTKRISTAAYYLEPPNYQRHKRLLPKRSTLTDSPTPEIVAPRKSSIQEISSEHPNKCSETMCCAETMKRRRSTSSTVHNRCQNADCARTNVQENFNQRIIEPRPVTAWTRATTVIPPCRPQLHIFMPNLPSHAKAASFDGSDCGLSAFE